MIMCGLRKLSIAAASTETDELILRAVGDDKEVAADHDASRAAHTGRKVKKG